MSAKVADNKDEIAENNEENDEVIESSTNGENTLTENSIQTNAEASNSQEQNSNLEEQIQSTSNTDEKTSSDDYFSSVRIERDRSYSQMLESYTNILKDTNVPNDQKSIATNEIKKINDRKNQISTIESLLEAKDIEDSVILINDNSIDAIIKSDIELSSKTVAQIENVISRELNADIEDIHISTHK